MLKLGMGLSVKRSCSVPCLQSQCRERGVREDGWEVTRMLLQVGKTGLCSISIMLALIGGLAARGESDPVWPVPRGPSHEPAPYHYDPGVLKTVPKEFLEDAPACILYSGITYVVEA